MRLWFSLRAVTCLLLASLGAADDMLNTGVTHDNGVLKLTNECYNATTAAFPLMMVSEGG